MQLTWPSITLVYDSERWKDAVTFKPRYSSLNQRKGEVLSLPVRAMLALKEWPSIQLKIQSFWLRVWGGWSGPLEARPQCPGHASQRVNDLEAAIRQLRQIGCMLDSCTICQYEVTQAQKAILQLHHTARGASTSSEELNAQISPRTDDEHNLPWRLPARALAQWCCRKSAVHRSAVRSNASLNFYRTTRANAYVNHAHQTQAQRVSP